MLFQYWGGFLILNCKIGVSVPELLFRHVFNKLGVKYSVPIHTLETCFRYQ